MTTERKAIIVVLLVWLGLCVLMGSLLYETYKVLDK